MWSWLLKIGSTIWGAGTTLIPWWGRWAAILALVAAIAAWGAFKMHEHDETAYDALSEKFQVFVDLTKAAGKAAQKEKARKELEAAAETKKLKDGYEKTIADLRRDNAALGLRLVAELNSGGRIVPDVPHPAGTVAAECYDGDKLELGIRSSLERFATRSTAVLQRGEASGAVVEFCRAWIAGQQKVFNSSQPKAP